MTAADTERVDQIRERLAAATKGATRASNRPDDTVGNSSVVLDGRYIITNVPWDDAALYAHARDDIDWLLARLAEQDATIREAHALSLRVVCPPSLRDMLAADLGSQPTEG